jgi:hypothetical protein
MGLIKIRYNVISELRPLTAEMSATGVRREKQPVKVSDVVTDAKFVSPVRMSSQPAVSSYDDRKIMSRLSTLEQDMSSIKKYVASLEESNRVFVGNLHEAYNAVNEAHAEIRVLREKIAKLEK